MRAAVLGASGYAGTEVLRLLLGHPELDLVLATADSAAGTPLAVHAPSLAAGYPGVVLAAHDSVRETDLDVAFICLPHGHSTRYVTDLRRRGIVVVDLGADFRLREPQHYESWYQQAHGAPELLSTAVYGLVERHRAELVGAGLIAVPGCYPTATALALGPFVDAEWVERRGIVVNALSGASGAGRATSDRLHFARLEGNAEAYGLLHHRHTIEMQQELSVELLFTPHLVPMSRGMLVTAYAPLAGRHDTGEALELLHQVYDDEPFVVVVDDPPSLKDPLGSNLCFVSVRIDPRTGWLVAMSSVDNLGKGAGGQAVQALNVSRGWPETWGLSAAGVAP